MALITSRRTILVSAAAFTALPNISRAASHSVEMLNKHPEDSKLRYVFYPLITTVEPGDDVVFLPTTKGHNTASTKGMMPEGAEEWKSKINEEYTVTFEQPGIYGYHCTPHITLGMVGLVIVRGDGMSDNLEAAKAVKQRGRAKKVWEAIWAQVEAENLLS